MQELGCSVEVIAHLETFKPTQGCLVVLAVNKPGFNGVVSLVAVEFESCGI
jgi:hypothetical protein